MGYSYVSGINYKTAIVMFVPVTRNVYKWETVDPEYGEMMAGHLFMKDGGIVLIDPPMAPGLINGLAPLGKVIGVLVTSASHKRGALFASAFTGSTYYFPSHLKQGSGLETNENVKFYDESTELPLGLKALRVKTEVPIIGEHHVDEMALLTGDYAFVGDVAHGSSSLGIAFAPEEIVPSPEGNRVMASFNALDKAVKGSVKTIFCGHGDDIVDSYKELMDKRRSEFKG